MTDIDTNATLRGLMKEFSLTRKQVADILGLPIQRDRRYPRTWNSSTVDSWLADPGSTKYRRMPVSASFMLTVHCRYGTNVRQSED